jgi:hypothetical protein
MDYNIKEYTNTKAIKLEHLINLPNNLLFFYLKLLRLIVLINLVLTLL